MPGQVTIVDGPAIPWVNGREAYDSMEPAFRDNLGDPDRVGELLSRYWLRPLWIDPATTRRIDHVRTEPGYRDLSEAYHDSVEEALFLGGRAVLTAEGEFQAGDYFWRPPGWVHSASSDEGFECVLMMEGESASDGSGRVSRVVRPDEEAGRHARPGASDPIGPRGYVRRKEGRFMVWRDHDDTLTRLAEPGVPGLRCKVLSRASAGIGMQCPDPGGVHPRGPSRPVTAVRPGHLRHGRKPMTQVDTTVTGSVMTITLNAPDRMNSVSPETIDGLNAALDAAERDDSLSSLVITGTGRAFCVGMDIGFLGECFADPHGVFVPFIRRFHAFLDRLEAFPLPSVAAVNGLTRAGGFELLLACDFVIAADEAKVGDTHSDFGVVPGAGASQRAPRKLGDQRARALMLAGRWLTGPEMVEWGLALSSVPAAELADEVARLTATLGDRSRAVTGIIKRLLNAAPDVTLAEGLRLERELFTRFLEEVPDADEGYRAYVEKRRPVWNSR